MVVCEADLDGMKTGLYQVDHYLNARSPMILKTMLYSSCTQQRRRSLTGTRNPREESFYIIGGQSDFKALF